MDENTLIYRRTISERPGNKLVFLLSISVGLLMAFLSLWTIYQALVDSATDSELCQSVTILAIGGFLASWGFLFGRRYFGEVTFGISERGLLLPHPMTLTLSKNKDRFLPFEDIKAIYTNEYLARKVDDPAIMIRLRNGGLIAISYDNVGSIPSVVNGLQSRTKVYRDRDCLQDGMKVFHPSASVEIRGNDILIVTDQARIVLPVNMIAAVRRAPFAWLKLRDGSRVGFHSLSPQLLEKIKRLRKSAAEGKTQGSHPGSGD